MFKNIGKANSVLRTLMFFLGGFFLLIKLTESKKVGEPEDDGFQTRDFDDIW